MKLEAIRMPVQAQRDFSPSTKLKQAPGELWVEIKLKRNWSANSRESTLLDQFIDRVRECKIGRYSGRSSGGGAMDVTFDVRNRATASKRLRSLLLEEFPGTVFCVSARYLLRFHDPNRAPPASARISFAEMEALIAPVEAEDAKQSPSKRKGRAR
jgi:hypothetical protein